MQTENFSYNDEQFADLQMLRYRVDGFEHLSLARKKLVYYLSEAALSGRDILWDQNGRYNLRIRKTLEAVYTGYCGNRDGTEFKAFTIYLKRVWFSNGIHHHYGGEKFKPGFSEAFFREAVGNVPLEELPIEEGQTAGELCDLLVPVIFYPEVMSKRVNRTDGDDLVKTSASNYYGEGVTQAEAEAFYGEMKREGGSDALMYGMNSRLVKRGGKLTEEVWKSGGLYGAAIDRIIAWLEKAAAVTENAKQAAVIRKLVEFYRTGDLRTFEKYTILWVQETKSPVDFVNGFTETYGDPLGLKASWEGYVNFKDTEATERAEKLSAEAQWFEDNSPVDEHFKKKECRGVSARVVKVAILGGDLYPSSAIGINLPNSDRVRAEYGSKSVTIGNLTDAYDKAACGNGFLREFAIDDETLRFLERYRNLTDDLHTDLHECLGHGSGRLLPDTDPDALKAYGATIEEARADLFGLYYIADPKLTDMGLLPDAEAYKAQYYSYMMNGLLTQAVRIELGHDIEEAHMRNRALIAGWTYEHGRGEGTAELVRREGKTYVRIRHYARLRELFGILLREVQRIKSEGDYEAAHDLVERYGVKIDPSLHAEVVRRYRALHLSPYKGFINPVYVPVFDEKNEITDVRVEYGEAYDAQMLRYGRDYATLPWYNE